MAEKRKTESEGKTTIPRRAFVQNGLSVFASLMASRALGACETPVANTDASSDAMPDASMPDAMQTPDATARIDVQMPAEPAYMPPRRSPPRPALRSLIDRIGPLGDPDANGLRLPAGFRSRIIGRTGERVPGTNYEWHIFPDGGATFATDDGGWIYVSNSEMLLRMGGVSAVRFSSTGEIRSAYRILGGTNINCAGGPTPWHTWLSCEEADLGLVYECDPWGEHRAIVRPALGVFKHEAAAIDPDNAHVYLTEDQTDGRFYRFVPTRRTMDGHPDLNEGTLQVAIVDAQGMVTWQTVPDPRMQRMVPTRMQVPESTAFDGGEGIWFHRGVIYFSSKGDNRVRAYDIRSGRMTVLYDGRVDPRPIRGVDNLTVSCCGDVLVAEDGGSMQIVAILPSGQFKPLVQVMGQATSEMTGPAFDPSGTRLYFSSQREPGTTYEVTGPFHEPLS